MKKIFIISLLCVCLTAAFASASAKLVSSIDAPEDDIEINYIVGKSKRDLAVNFSHSAHEDIDCFKCHHKNEVKDEPESCSNCHTKTDPDAKGFQSYFRAMHVKNKTKSSCLSCHVKEFPGDKEMTGCVNSACHPNGLQ